MKNKLLLTLTMMSLFLISLGLASAVTEFIIPFNQEFDLKRACFNNGTFCSSSAICNATVFYPDGNILTNNQQMTNQFSFHNITFTNINISQLGTYSTFVICNDVGLLGDDTFEIEVTGDGFKGLAFPLQFSIIFLGFILIFASYFDERMKIFRVVGGFTLMGMGVVTLYPGYANFNYSTLQGQILGLIIIGLGLFFTLVDSLSFDRQVDHFDQADDGRFHG